LPGPVTSPFGWRRDPFTGRPQFHNGTDVRLAYGENVRAFANGRVVFAGDQRGYGTTVVVEDGAHERTRYAHLSGTTVSVGDQVTAGQIIARSGNSGRSTGAHLHVEVVRDGHPVDPATVLKESSPVADSSVGVDQEQP
jgi:murein DD-endopeptidase MepM/ murein hydrolase activator NlpD